MFHKPSPPTVDTIATLRGRLANKRRGARLPSTTSLLRAVQDERLAVEVLGRFDASSTRMRADLNASLGCDALAQNTGDMRRPPSG